MTYLALDKITGDLYKPEGGGVTRVTDGRFVVQQVQSKLRTLLGEWILDPTVGWVSMSDFEKNYDRSGIERRAREIILETQGVRSIELLTTSYSKRKLTIQFRAKTLYGFIDLSVPWGVL